MLAAGLVDELFLSVSPMLVGGGEPSVVEGTAFEQPRELQLVSVLEHESFLYLRYALGVVAADRSEHVARPCRIGRPSPGGSARTAPCPSGDTTNVPGR